MTTPPLIDAKPRLKSLAEAATENEPLFDENAQRAVLVRPGGLLEKVQICPFGEFPNGSALQICDRAAFEQIAANAAGREILVDFEHKSEDPSLTSDTSAAAWLTNLAVDDARGLVGDMKFTDLGAEAVTNRRLRFLSPVWTLDQNGRPDRLRSVALTNKPNIPVACVLNREPQPATQPVEDTKEDPAMDKIKQLLGLAPDATDEDVAAAVQALQDQIAQANKEKDEAEADTFAEEHKEVCNKAALKSAYLMNKEAAKALVAGFVKPAPAAPQTILNKETPATPAVKLNKAQEGLAACKSAEERVAYVTAHAKEFT